MRPGDSSMLKSGTLRPPTAVQKGIPAARPDRQRLLECVRDYVAQRRLVPPLSIEDLTQHAADVLTAAGLGEECQDYAGVLVNNEVWRNIVAGIPYSRRLLLLPQCLRASETCPAELDEYGLLCQRCGGCGICEFQTEAEGLGYAVMVAEGSPVVMSLIESGKIDAVVGVSCLAMLERVFPYMEAGAVPGVAIPLLHDGCNDTAVDAEWVWDVIYMTSEDTTRRLDLEALRRQVDAWFTEASLADLFGPAETETEQIARDWLLRAGKRWRPFLAACTFEAIAGQAGRPIPDDFRKLALAVECFHKASLVHDDIEDDDASRYGQRALHEQYGVPVALNVGDFLLGLGYRLLAETDRPPESTARMLRAAADGHLTLCLGQGRELCWARRPRPLSLEEVFHIFRQKTAPTFEVALRLGAIYAGADEDMRTVLRNYSEALGVAYQVRDDIDDFAGGSDPGDLYGIRPNVLLAIAHESADPAQRELVDRVWRHGGQDAAAAADILPLLKELHVEPLARQLLEAEKCRAIRCLGQLDNPNLKGLLRRVVAKIFNDFRPMGCCDDDPAGNAPLGRAGTETAE